MGSEDKERVQGVMDEIRNCAGTIGASMLMPKEPGA